MFDYFRVHACLYFIAPTGHGLKPLDVEVMKKIHKKVNIIPVIGKADSCTVKEVNMFKTKVSLIVRSEPCNVHNKLHYSISPHASLVLCNSCCHPGF